MTIQLYNPTLVDIRYAQVYSRLEHEPIVQSIILRVAEHVHPQSRPNLFEMAFHSRDEIVAFMHSLDTALAQADEKAKSI